MLTLLFRAYIEKPNNEIEIVELFDNGVNADTTLADGVYSKYFPNATQPGRYSVKCQVTNNGQAFESLGFIASANPYIPRNIYSYVRNAL